MSEPELEKMRAAARPAIVKFAAAGHADLVKDIDAKVAKLRK